MKFETLCNAVAKVRGNSTETIPDIVVYVTGEFFCDAMSECQGAVSQYVLDAFQTGMVLGYPIYIVENKSVINGDRHHPRFQVFER